MNRRGFLETMLKVAAGATILPPALTYTRHWKGVIWEVNLNQQLIDRVMGVDMAADGVSMSAVTFIRHKLREEGFARQILMPVPIPVSPNPMEFFHDLEEKICRAVGIPARFFKDASRLISRPVEVAPMVSAAQRRAVFLEELKKLQT